MGTSKRTLITANCLRDVVDGGRFRIPDGALVTDLAYEEAWARRIQLEGDVAPSPGETLDVLRDVVRAGACRVGICSPVELRLGELASFIDHTQLKPDATAAQIDQLCAEALEQSFATVCVNGCWVERVAEILAGSPVQVCCVVGFPLGAARTSAKVFEAADAISAGACEIDMVLNVGALKSGLDQVAERDIAAVANRCHELGARLKVILETCLLTNEEIQRASRCAERAGADFIKTSTGFSTGGATVEHVALMRSSVDPGMGIKASGGVRNQDDARAMIAAGATRLGTSASVAIVRGGQSSGGY